MRLVVLPQALVAMVPPMGNLLVGYGVIAFAAGDGVIRPRPAAVTRATPWHRYRAVRVAAASWQRHRCGRAPRVPALCRNAFPVAHPAMRATRMAYWQPILAGYHPNGGFSGG
ncbi:hypothetical protein [Saccharothrix australiensis]|uniref:Uncharacterized protein n=1 Tax=Saccharothrix australiensis TaxID=2072 RepID=A0A495W201_9PSEU|nr:hypothetical protein [Saccharothrix australiensis]RKT55160.1 hypothetical protein C8E97_3818 [Saccharothrix australiensis]